MIRPFDAESLVVRQNGLQHTFKYILEFKSSYREVIVRSRVSLIYMLTLTSLLDTSPPNVAFFEL